MRTKDEEKDWAFRVADEKTNRVRSLQGKYVVTRLTSYGEPCYLLDRTKFEGCKNWSKHLDYAVGFDNPWIAEQVRTRMENRGYHDVIVKKVTPQDIDDAVYSIDAWYYSRLDFIEEKHSRNRRVKRVG